MIEWVDTWLQQWAAEVRGGLPGRFELQGDGIGELGRELSSGELSDDAWRMECVVRDLALPLQTVVKVHYLPTHGSTRERVQALAFQLGDKASRPRGVFRGTAAHRSQVDAALSRQQARYYRLLNQAHDVVAARVRLAQFAS